MTSVCTAYMPILLYAFDGSHLEFKMAGSVAEPGARAGGMWQCFFFLKKNL